MQKCFQTENQTVLEHGQSVWRHLKQLIDGLSSPIEGDWRLPSWYNENKEFLKERLLPIEIIEEYAVYHDNSKPFVKFIDENGKQHFPNHAQKSKEIWLEVGGNIQSAQLMGYDMDIHNLKAEGIKEFALRPEAVTLILTGLSEVHSNSRMFGGFESTSFKIKWKQIDKRGRQIIEQIKENFK